jgi:hypothetical protein
MNRILPALSLALLLHHQGLAHHGPGLRGFNSSQTIAINGVIKDCLYCNNGSKGHGVLLITVGTVPWEATLPDTPVLRKLKVSLAKLKKGAVVRITGFANPSKDHRIYANEIIVDGVRLYSHDPLR